MKRILSLFVVLFFVVGFSGITEVRAEEPALAQCQGEPSKGTGWGTFWIIYGGLNSISGAAAYGVADDYENISKGTAIGAMVVGGVLSGLGWSMRHNANSYNEACSQLLSNTNVEPAITRGTTFAVYRW